MTVIEATRSLLNFFNENDVFIVKDDLIKVIPISMNEDLDRDIIILALSDFAVKDLVRPLIKYGQKTDVPYGYVLTKPLAEYTQSLELNFATLLALTNTINTFCDDLKLEKGRVNPLNVSEEDIGNLIIIIQTLKNQIDPHE